MWVRTQSGALVNLDHARKVEIGPREPKATFPLVADMEWGAPVLLYEGTEAGAAAALEMIAAGLTGEFPLFNLLSHLTGRAS